MVGDAHPAWLTWRRPPTRATSSVPIPKVGYTNLYSASWGEEQGRYA